MAPPPVPARLATPSRARGSGLARRLASAAAMVCIGLSSPVLAAAPPLMEPRAPHPMTDDDMAEIVDFVVGNAVFALYHQAGHMLMQRYGAVPKGIADAERASDLFAVVTLLDPRSGAGDQTLVDAIDSWKLASPDAVQIAAPDLDQRDLHGVDGPRAEAIACDMVGADPEGFADIAEASGLDAARRRVCGATWKREQAAWAAALKALPRPKEPTTPFDSIYGPASEEDAPAATILKDNGVLEEVAATLARRFAFAKPPILRAETCGTPTTRYDAAANELVLCYELSSAHTRLIMRDIEQRN